MRTERFVEEVESDVSEQVVLDFLPFLRYTARRLSWGLPPSISEEDLVSVGVVGLLDALRRFREGTVKLKTFAEHRIKGAMLDELRTADILPRGARDRVNAMKSAHGMLERTLGRLPEDPEVAEALGVSLDDYHKTLRESGAALQIRFEDFGPRKDEDGFGDLLQNFPDVEGKDPLSLAERREIRTQLTKVVAELPEKEQLVLSLYYRDELTMKEIGKAIGLTEGRVCQIHGQALLRCKARFEVCFA
jgi:RNA polymerase sigma factor FliA